MKRIFLGLALPEPLPAPLREALKKLRTSAAKGEYRLKWTEPGNFHLTLKFIGATERAGEILAAAQELAPKLGAYRALELELHGFGAFPNEQSARVAWVGVRSKVNLRALRDEVEEAFAALGFPRDEREFHPHVTVARVRSKQSLRDLLSPFVRKDFGAVPVTGITVFESVLGGIFPRYESLGNFPLG